MVGYFPDLAVYLSHVKIFGLAEVGHGFGQVGAEGRVKCFESWDDFVADEVTLAGGGPLCYFPAVGEEQGADEVSRFFAEAGNPFDACFPEDVDEEGFDEVVLVVGSGDNVVSTGCAYLFKPGIAQFACGHFDGDPFHACIVECIEPSGIELVCHFCGLVSDEAFVAV